MPQYIAHFYPDSDARQFFKTGRLLEIIGPVFDTYAEANTQIMEEIDDVAVQDLPVGGYIIEVEHTPKGYRVLDCFDLDVIDPDEDHARESNPRKSIAASSPKSGKSGKQYPNSADKIKHPIGGAFKPKGEAVQFRLNELKDITTDPSKSRVYTPEDASIAYGQFVATKSPKTISVGKFTAAFREHFTPPDVLDRRREAAARSADSRKKREANAAEIAREKIEESHGNLDKAKSRVNDLRREVKMRESNKEITPFEAKQTLAQITVAAEIIDTLKTFCPQVDKKALDAAVERISELILSNKSSLADAVETLKEGVNQAVEENTHIPESEHEPEMSGGITDDEFPGDAPKAPKSTQTITGYTDPLAGNGPEIIRAGEDESEVAPELDEPAVSRQSPPRNSPKPTQRKVAASGRKQVKSAKTPDSDFMQEPPDFESSAPDLSVNEEDLLKRANEVAETMVAAPEPEPATQSAPTEKRDKVKAASRVRRPANAALAAALTEAEDEDSKPISTPSSDDFAKMSGDDSEDAFAMIKDLEIDV
jgi:hypothetical protein